MNKIGNLDIFSQKNFGHCVPAHLFFCGEAISDVVTGIASGKITLHRDAKQRNESALAMTEPAHG